jgi:hypothetical protein
MPAARRLVAQQIAAAVRGRVEGFLADSGLEGDLAELARFALLWMAGALVIAGPPDRISLTGAAAWVYGKLDVGSRGELSTALGLGA